MLFYDKIDYLCRVNKINRKQMCEGIELSYNTYNSMLRRKSTNITLDVIEKIANFFNVSVDYLVRDEINDPNFKQAETPTPVLEMVRDDLNDFTEEEKEELRQFALFIKQKRKQSEEGDKLDGK